MKYLLYIFYLEIAISLFSGVQALFTPATFLTQLSTESAPVLALEITRWYGVVLFVLVYALFQGLRVRGTALKIILQALLLGDVLHIGATFVTAKALGGWNFTLYMAVILSVFYLIIRAICLWKPIETGVDK